MSDWGGGTLSQIQATSLNVGVTPNATANTKGSYVSFNTLVSPSFGLLVCPSWGQALTTSRTIFVDISSGGAGSEVVLISNFAYSPGGYSSGAATSRTKTQQHVFLPIYVPSGEIRLRNQASVASHGVCYFGIVSSTSYIQQQGSFSVCDTYGANTGSTRGVAVTASSTENVYGSWAEITASCSRVRSLIVAILHGNSWQTAHNDQWHQFQIGIGSAGNEVAVFSSAELGINLCDGGMPHPYIGPLYLDIPDGTRISIRMKRQHTTQRTLDFILYGFR